MPKIHQGGRRHRQSVRTKIFCGTLWLLSPLLSFTIANVTANIWLYNMCNKPQTSDGMEVAVISKQIHMIKEDI